jgi:hypothetical protein
MSVISPYEISQANCLNSNAYTTTECDPWQKECIMMLNMCSLFNYPKLTLNSLRNVSKSLSKGD